MKKIKFILIILGLETALIFLSYMHNYDYSIFTFHIPLLDSIHINFPKIELLTKKNENNNIKEAEIFKLLDSLPEFTIVKPPEAPKITIHYHFNVDSSLRILNPYNEKTGLFALDPFFENLYKLQSKQDINHLHIAFYGDSQIEGDRITRIFRSYLQRTFGGNGLGFLPIITPATNFSIAKRELYGHWIRKSIFQYKRKYNNCYGPSGNVYFFINDNDTLPAIELQLKDFVYYDSLFLLLGNVKQKLIIKVYNQQNILVLKDSIAPTNKFLKYSINLPTEVKNHFKMEFISKTSPEFYGLVFDVNNGIQVDNYAIRGHGGQGWKYADVGCTATFLKLLNTKLIILEYGGNAVPYETENYQWFGYELDKIIKFFKKALPGVPILVIGVGDMAKATPESVESYPSIEQIRTIQKQIAIKNGCAFWDLFTVMGGKNSIIEWVKQGLAAKDYAHFSYYGQKLIAKVLFQALMYEYQQFLKRKNL